MKFEYDERECVALVCNGHLYIKTDGGCVLLYDDGTPETCSDTAWISGIHYADRKFYPGDKITITF